MYLLHIMICMLMIVEDEGKKNRRRKGERSGYLSSRESGVIRLKFTHFSYSPYVSLIQPIRNQIEYM